MIHKSVTLLTLKPNWLTELPMRGKTELRVQNNKSHKIKFDLRCKASYSKVEEVGSDSEVRSRTYIF